MTDETETRKNCPHCGALMRSNNTRGVCKSCWDASKRPGGGDVAPRAEAPPKSKRVKPPAPAGPDWQAQFFQLAGALGLNPEEMLTDFCRGWVEDTRRRALGDPKPETPVSE